MDEAIQYVGAMTVGTFSLPLALALGWVSLRLILDCMPIHSRSREQKAPRPLLVAPVRR